MKQEVNLKERKDSIRTFYKLDKPDKQLIVSPIFVVIPRKRSAGKRFPLNLNNYRNVHFHINNEAKRIYKVMMKEQIQSIINISWPIKINYRYFLARKADVSNINAIVEKFFLDALVELGRIPDDSVDYVIAGSYCFVGIDRANPRCEITIVENYNGEQL